MSRSYEYIAQIGPRKM